MTPSTILQSDVLWSHIYRRVPALFADRGALQPPTLLAIDEFEGLMGVVETGRGLPDVLAQRLSSPYRRMPMSHFLSAMFRDAPRPVAVDQALKAAAAAVRAVLFEGDK